MRAKLKTLATAKRDSATSMGSSQTHSARLMLQGPYCWGW